MKDKINKLICALMMTSTLAMSQETPLLEACKNRNITLLQTLIDNGEDINHQNEYGRTVLHYAVFFKEIDVARCLILNGADIHLKDVQSRTPLSYLFFDGAGTQRFHELHELYQSLSRDPVLK